MSFTSPFPDIAIPTDSLYDYLLGGLTDAEADQVALVEAATGATTTYRELVAGVDAVAGALAARGITVGDVVALLAPNSSAFAIVFHAILRAGATATTVNALFTPADIAKQLTDSGAKMLVTVTALLPHAEEAARRVALGDSELVVLDGGGEEADGRPNLADLLAAGAAAPQVDFDSATHLAVLPYSSGTTGQPKGVMLTHRNLVANMAQIRSVQRLRADDVVLALMPFFHIYGMNVLLNASLLARSRLVIMTSFDLDQFLGCIEKYRCTKTFIAPPVAVVLAKHPLVDSYDLSSLTTIMSGAAPLDEVLGHAVAQRLGCTVAQGYGMTELSPVSHCTPFDIPNDPSSATAGPSVPAAPPSSCGWPVANSVNRIVDPQTGADIDIPATGLSEAGELWFKGPNVMAGYLGNDQATRETVDEEGFLHTGDLARVDADGCVYIVDRLKELIKYKGYQVPPAELEALLLTHPGVADAAVIGVIDDSGEEIPKAFVVRQHDTALTGPEVMAFVAANVAPYKKIRQVEFLDAIPKSASGKILRKDLRTG